MNNLMLNFLQGDRILDTIDAEIYLHSLIKQKNFKKLICVYDVSQRNIEKLKKFYDFIVPVKENMHPFNHTYYAYYNWLCENGSDFDYVMQWDMRDIIIQKDPFEFMKLHSNKELFLVCEGMQIKDNKCNLTWQEWVLRTLAYKNDRYDDSYVLNGGTYGGKTSAFLSYCSLITMAMNRKYDYVIPDQAMLGFLYNHLQMNPNVMLCHPYSDDFCATGEAIKWGNINVNFDGKSVLNLENQPYYLFHQWDRTVHAETIRNNFKNTLSFVI
jgi:hypothetical protein